MANETPGEMPEQQVETPAQPAEPKAETAPSTPDAKALEAELDKVRKALKEANKEAADRRKRLDELEKAETERRQAEMSEQEKLQARLSDLEKSIAEKDNLLKVRELQDLRNKVAKAVAKELGVTVETAEALASRLNGSTEEELTEDAKAVFALLPKPQEEKKPAPKLPPTNPGDGKQGETAAQKRARLLGTSVNPWTADGAADRGGGVIEVIKD